MTTLLLQPVTTKFVSTTQQALALSLITKIKKLSDVNDVNTNATFSAANKADLGAYTYQAEQRGNTCRSVDMELTDYANMALNIPSANTNIWNLEQDTVGTRLTNSRHGLADNGGDG